MMIKIILLQLFVLMMFNSIVQANAPALRDRPNVVVIVVDDQRWDEYGAAGHPYVSTPNIDRLAKEGVTFTSAYVASPLCSPNRASILTGQYISRHGVVDNLARNMSSKRLDLFAKDLQLAGYQTAHIGKWHMGNDPTPRPGYDYWLTFPGQGRSINPELYEDGALHEVKGYMTDLLSDRAVEFIAEERDTPFFLYLGHKAIHPEVKQKDDSTIDFTYKPKYQAAERHIGRYKNKIWPRRKNYQNSEMNPDFPGKPVLQEALQYKNSEKMGKKWDAVLDKNTSEQTIQDRAEMLLAVDEGLGRILDELARQNILDETMVLFTSDNGYYYGEHGLSVERRLPYEEAVRIPFLIRFPQLAPAGVRINQFVQSIDIAPTVLDLADASIGLHVQGQSLIPLLMGAKQNWRKSILIEFTSYEKPMPWLVDASYKIIRKGKYKYIHWIHHKNSDE
ncbi:MAG: sulfatase-like hydrolase/transferase, partial [Gammaproteobacteria bacterium]|nr:sulfatase-like hydrolase/transferase [Gammaproteobacteria bacterium]